MQFVVHQFASLQPMVLLIFFGILVAGLLGYVLWARPVLDEARRGLEALNAQLRTPRDASAEPTGPAETAPMWLQQAWAGTRSRLIHVGAGEQRRPVLLGSVADLWQAERLLQQRFNLALFEAVPNLAVGVGLFFTFLFLTFALTDATAALTVAGTANPVSATKDLLSSAGGKFLSSLAGLFVSLAWTVVSKQDWARVQRASDAVVEAIEACWPAAGAEAVTTEQLLHLSRMDGRLAEQHAAAQDQLAMAGEQLMELRDQTGVLKYFQTDLALSIGKAVSANFSPHMEEMTARLEKAITDLSDRMSSMNEDALRTMMKDFSQAMSANAAQEMQEFKNTLSDLAGRLDASAGQLKSGVEGAAAQLGSAGATLSAGLLEASDKLTSDVANAAQGLGASVAGMETVIARTREAVQEVDATVRRAAAAGSRGAELLEESLESAHTLVDDVADVAGEWKRIREGMTALVAKLTDACDSVDELTDDQQAVAKALQGAVPELVTSIAQMRAQMEGAVRGVADAMQQVQGSMGRTSTDLTGVVNAIKEGVVEYSRELASLHQNMDAAMAKAVGKLGGAIQNLDESIEDLTDGLAGVRQHG